MLKKANQIKLGAILSYASLALNVIAGLFYTPWIKNQIGIGQFGLYTLATSVISLFMFDFGLNSTVTRYVSLYHAENNEEKVFVFLGAVYKIYFIIDAIIFLALTVFYFFINQVYIKLSPYELTLFKGVYIISGFYALVNFPFITLGGILTAYEKFIQLKLADMVYRILVVALTVASLLNGGKLYALVICNAVAGLVLIGLKFFFIKKTTNIKVVFQKNDKKLYKEILSFSVWVMLMALAQRMIFNITPTILGYFCGSTAIAVFGTVITLEGYTYLFATAINGMFMPRISRIYSNDDQNTELLPLMLKVGRFQYALNGLIVVGFAVIGKDFVTLWMGKEFIDAYYGVLLVIIPGMFLNSLQIANTAMMVDKKVHLQAYIFLFTGILNVILSIILSKFFGIIGACVSIFIAYMVRAIIQNIVIKKHLMLDIKIFCKKCYLQLLPPILISLLSGLILCRFIPVDGWLGLIIKGILIVFVYLCFLWLLGLQKAEKQQIINMVCRRANEE